MFPYLTFWCQIQEPCGNPLLPTTAQTWVWLQPFTPTNKVPGSVCSGKPVRDHVLVTSLVTPSGWSGTLAHIMSSLMLFTGGWNEADGDPLCLGGSTCPIMRTTVQGKWFSRMGEKGKIGDMFCLIIVWYSPPHFSDVGFERLHLTIFLFFWNQHPPKRSHLLQWLARCDCNAGFELTVFFHSFHKYLNNSAILCVDYNGVQHHEPLWLSEK